jgi:prevent-host-death family protein
VIARLRISGHVVTITTLENAMRKNVVGSRELKTRLGTYLRQIQRGRTLVVTERGRPVAEMTPVRVKRTSEEDKLEELIVLGLLSRSSRDPLQRLKPLRIGGKPASAAILEDREDRF